MGSSRWGGLPVPLAWFVTDAEGREHVVITDQDEHLLNVPQVWSEYFGKTLNELAAGVNASMVRPLVPPANAPS